MAENIVSQVADRPGLLLVLVRDAHVEAFRGRDSDHRHVINTRVREGPIHPDVPHGDAGELIHDLREPLMTPSRVAAIPAQPGEIVLMSLGARTRTMAPRLMPPSRLVRNGSSLPWDRPGLVSW